MLLSNHHIDYLCSNLDNDKQPLLTQLKNTATIYRDQTSF